MQLDLIGFTKRFDGTPVVSGMDLSVASGEMIALLGPSGCGKSTTLFAICGIHRIDEGRLMFGERDVSGLPSQRRNVGVVFQNYALYPHMSVFDNIAFPLKVQKADKDQIRRRVGEMAELVHIETLLDRRPAQLSGGQQQRVALARALVRNPDVLLLDEPLANLDAKLRLEMRSEIRRIQQETGLTAILVTHDQVEAMSMCDRIALMNNGRIVQIDGPTRMYRDPMDKFVASFLGNPPISFVTPEDLPCFGAPKACAEIGLRPEHVGPQFGTGLTGEVRFVETQGREDLFDIALPSGRMIRSVQPAGSGLRPGQTVDWGYDAAELLCFDRQEVRL
ncbi:ABC transporter ATP-binding protein [Pseudoponticoccus marisrubri]|uniref:ABC transporter n=1 Tax=Pseudoponticoccus marisrubri TaxID=1685382 RepID=A0A0W7WHC8_9RHOB|nr:ABC transporter ATP-binding protein [Pseudoponticoccus marisrubri]KUF09997.1 ABC transporter [Pseudoponticoccus marisrubri]